MNTIFVTRDFKQGAEAVILTVFDDFVEIQTDTPANYAAWQVTNRDDELNALKTHTVNELKKTQGLAYDLNGISYNIPITNEDALGLLQVKAAFDMGVTNTVIYFSNGVKMPVTADDFITFAAWYVTERNKFFV